MLWLHPGGPKLMILANVCLWMLLVLVVAAGQGSSIRRRVHTKISVGRGDSSGRYGRDSVGIGCHGVSCHRVDHE